jgi:competence protein ComEA
MQAADSAKQAAGGKHRSKPAAAKQQGGVAVIAAPRAKLDVDVATAAQLDSLPGMTPTVAKHIVVDRMQHGPFASLGRLSRVNGVTTKLLQRIDTLVVFSGAVITGNANDTVIPRRGAKRSKR